MLSTSVTLNTYNITMLVHLRHFIALVVDFKLGFELSTSRSVTSVMMRYFVEFHCRFKDEAVECEEDDEEEEDRSINASPMRRRSLPLRNAIV